MPSTSDKCQPIRDALKDVRDVKQAVEQGLEKIALAEQRLILKLEECENENQNP